MLKTENSSLIKKSKFAAIFDSMQPFLNAMKALNTKSEETPTEADVNTVMSSLYDDDNALDQVVDQIFHLGGAMYTTAIQYIVAQSIISLPAKYADKLVTDDQSSKGFKKGKNVKALQRFLHEQCLEGGDNSGLQTTSGPPRRSLLQELQGQQHSNTTHQPEDSTEECERQADQLQQNEDDGSGSKKRKKSKKLKKQNKKQKVNEDLGCIPTPVK
ncbi:uncharacterized protein LOC114544077 [Dendronephthya gigantea]|uniref:uncharacterized protein LOC114543886 n=1 Tax=Dendronephthya gigantea TaxID=151771 RepID=UPI001069D803|nr:uncharacterized protein LOC114543886 [Dendronephthya gigantea]XP_028418620.1 uncharacterized protein LOC114544077 [Dendronephthya gigantea]